MKKIIIIIEDDYLFDPINLPDWINNNYRNIDGYYDPCYNCGNNPKNNPHASGFCNCSLPSKNITY